MLRNKKVICPPRVGLMMLALLSGQGCPPLTAPQINSPPTADAGPDLERKPGERAVLDARGSSDRDGDPLSYSWTKTRQPQDYVLEADAAATASFVPPVEGIYELAVTCCDSRGACDTDTVKVTVGYGCGVFDAGTDGDGTSDCHDDCPSDRHKTVAGECGCGVPDTDTRWTWPGPGKR